MLNRCLPNHVSFESHCFAAWKRSRNETWSLPGFVVTAQSDRQTETDSSR